MSEVDRRWDEVGGKTMCREVVIRWVPKDVQDSLAHRGIKVSEDEAAAMLESIAKSLQDRSVERGWEVIEGLLP